jgi:hypothetical protein
MPNNRWDHLLDTHYDLPVACETCGDNGVIDMSCAWHDKYRLLAYCSCSKGELFRDTDYLKDVKDIVIL